MKENIRKDKQFSNGLSYLDRLGKYDYNSPMTLLDFFLDDIRRKDRDTSEDIYQANKFYEKVEPGRCEKNKIATILLKISRY